MGLVINKENSMEPFDLAQKPCKQYWFLMPLVWAGSWILTRKHHLKISKSKMEGIKPPFLVIGTHQGPVDYYVGPLAMFPHRALYVSDMEGFAAFGKWLYRGLGCIGKRRYVSDITVVRNMKYGLSMGQSVVVYPESRHSNVGTTAYLPENLGKMAKMMGAPVVILHADGNYLANPFWDEEHTRKVPVSVKMTCICNRDELSKISDEELQSRIEAGLSYDEYRYQQENHIHVRDKKRAEGLHKPLYRCKTCGTKYRMTSKGAELICLECNARWELTEDGWLEKNALSADDGKPAMNVQSSETAEKMHIPDWYEWERTAAINEIEQGVLEPARRFQCQIYALPNEKGFVDLGMGELALNEAEFALRFDDEIKRRRVCERAFEDFILHFPHAVRESVQTEYDYKGTGMCIVLSTRDCCYYVYSDDAGFNPTELQFYGEYLYQRQKKFLQ